MAAGQRGINITAMENGFWKAHRQPRPRASSAKVQREVREEPREGAAVHRRLRTEDRAEGEVSEIPPVLRRTHAVVVGWRAMEVMASPPRASRVKQSCND